MQVDLREKDLETLREVFRRFPSIQSVRVFGSRAKMSARRASDIDLAIIAPEMTDREWSDMREALDEAPIIYEMDVIRLETLMDHKLRDRIDKDGIEIYST